MAWAGSLTDRERMATQWHWMKSQKEKESVQKQKFYTVFFFICEIKVKVKNFLRKVN